MRKFTFLIAFLCFIGMQIVEAQQRTITGKVTNKDDGQPLPGATVLVKGTAIGTTTDAYGKYRLVVPAKYNLIVFSFIGMKTAEVTIGSGDVIDVVMEPDVMKIDEVVVTAIGIPKKEKSLGYSTTKVSGEELTKAKPTSAMNALEGKIAGVNITTASSNPGASTRVISRGFTTLSGSNQVLYVVDGIPIDNSSFGSTSLNGGTDFGNKANDINPEDIESITFLKGSSATALYGSRAANGVIVITTKKGPAGKGAGTKGANISYTTSFQLESVLKLPTYQNEFGEGFYGMPDLLENTSWGPRLDGKERVWGHVVDNSQQLAKYEALENNVKDFFEIGKVFTNNVSITDGNDNMGYFLSFSNVRADGIFPTDVDQFKRNTVSARGSAKLRNNFNSSFSLNYIKKQSSFVPTGQDQSVYDNVMQTPRNISLLDLKDYKNNKFNTLDNYYSPYTLNPWFVLQEHGNKYNEDRVFGNVNLDYIFLPWLSATFRMGSDVSNAQLKQWRAIVAFDPNGNNSTNSNADKGRVSEDAIFTREFNTDLFFNVVKNISKDLEFKGIIGWNVNQRNSKQSSISVTGLDIPYFYQLSNSSSTPVVDEYTMLRRLIGAYTSLDFGFRNYLFLTVTARNDWSSTLPTQNRSFFYPGANLSFVFTDAVPSIAKYIPFGKFRLGLAQTGNDANPYLIDPIFVQAQYSDGFRNLNFPLPGKINGFEVSNRIGNPNLQPEITTEGEIGLDLRFFQNRVGIDFTYYNKTIKDLIYDVPLPYSTGFSLQTMNIGKITNKGIEILLTLNPVKTKNFRWDIIINYSKNNNKLVELTQGLEKVALGGLSTISFVAIPGQPIGLIEGTVPKRDSLGRIVVDATGMPIGDEEKVILGNSQYKYMLGITNSLSYKNLSMSFLFDIRQGGLMYSRTADIMYFTGTAPQTTYNDRMPFIVPNSVVQNGVDANGDPVYIENTQPVDNEHLYTFWGNGGFEMDKSFLVDKSFVKLRELTISYSIPKKLTNKTPFSNINFGLIGRNLLLWTPSSNTFIDPELTTFGNDLQADYGEFSASPTTRSYGFSLNVTF